MFAKRSKSTARQETAPDDDSQTEQSGSAALGLTVERMTRELAEQQAAAKTLRESLDAALFKLDTLEKSYAKQLAEARDKRAAVELELQEKNEILANLGDGHEHTLRELNDALTVIKVLKKERDQLRKQIAQGGPRSPSTSKSTTKARELLGADDVMSGGTVAASGEDTSDGTINALIANAGWAEKKPGVGTGQATARVETEPEPPQTEMLSPDLVFTAKDKEKDDER
jgi:uncharacterized coiled-coil protein SlyX